MDSKMPTPSKRPPTKHKRRFCKVDGCERIVKSQGLCQVSFVHNDDEIFRGVVRALASLPPRCARHLAAFSAEIKNDEAILASVPSSNSRTQSIHLLFQLYNVTAPWSQAVYVQDLGMQKAGARQLQRNVQSALSRECGPGHGGSH